MGLGKIKGSIRKTKTLIGKQTLIKAFEWIRETKIIEWGINKGVKMGNNSKEW